MCDIIYANEYLRQKTDGLVWDCVWYLQRYSTVDAVIVHWGIDMGIAND